MSDPLPKISGSLTATQLRRRVLLLLALEAAQNQQRERSQAGGRVMSVKLLKTSAAFAFAFRCDSCSRAEVVALKTPAGWSAERGNDGRLGHRCSGCVFDELVSSLGWEREEAS